MVNEVGLGITIERARLPQKIDRAASYNLCITCVAWLNTLSSEIDIRAPTSEVMDKKISWHLIPFVGPPLP